MNKGRVVIVGGGAHGSAAATHLARVGYSVTVVERDHAGRHASGVNAGGVRRLGRHHAEIPLSVAALERWQKLDTIIGDDGGFRPCGQIKVAESSEDLAKLEARVDDVRNLGFDHEVMISRPELRRRLPALNGQCPGAIVCEGDGAADPWRTTTAWQRQAEREGARFIEDTSVVTIETSDKGYRVITSHQEPGVHRINADLLVNCAGAWAGQVCKWLGDDAPITPRALMMSVTERVASFVEPVVGATSRPLSLKQSPNGTVLIGGGLEGAIDSTTNTGQVCVEQLTHNAATAVGLFPDLATVNVVRSWAGIEAIMPDGIPVLGRSGSHPTAIHSFGYSAHGFQLSAITGEIVRDLALEREPDLPIGPLSIERFA